MIELTNSAVEILNANGLVTYDTEVVNSGCAESHKQGSAYITLRKAGRYRVTFNANVAVPSTATAGAISLVMVVNGEQLPYTTMTVTPTATGAYFNVASEAYIDVCCNCGARLAVINNGTTAEAVLNPNISVVRVC